MSLRSLYLLSLLAAGGSARAMSAGEYVAKAGDCTACHTAPGAELAGHEVPDAARGYLRHQHHAGQAARHRRLFVRRVRSRHAPVAKDGHRLYRRCRTPRTLK